MFIIFYIYAAVGATFFAEINPVLWGDISISLLTLFKIMTFEDWTDVMYETMTVYGYSWIFYLSFIFLTAFAFLNMVIGIVVNVLEDENALVQAEKDKAEGKITLEDLALEIRQLKALLIATNSQPIAASTEQTTAQTSNQSLTSSVTGEMETTQLTQTNRVQASA